MKMRPENWRGELGVQTELATNLQMRLFRTDTHQVPKDQPQASGECLGAPSKSRLTACRLLMDSHMKSEEKLKPTPAQATVNYPAIARSANCAISIGDGGVAIFDRPDDWTSFEDFLTEGTRFGRRMRCRPMDAFDADNPGDTIFLVADNDNEGN